MSPAKIGILLGGVVFAAAIGRWSAPTAEPPAPAPVAPPAAIEVPRAMPAAPAPPRAMPASVPAAVPAPPPAVVDEPAPPTAEQDGRAADAFALLDEALRRAAWTGDDWRRLESLLGDMHPEHRQEIFRALATAVNAGELTLEPPG